MRIYLILIIILFTLGINAQAQERDLYEGIGHVDFISLAPAETIQASSDQLKGIINLTDKTFAFSFQVASFEGFNSPLQKEHFNEHYLETVSYPKATFVGKIIGLDDCSYNCELEILTKGKFTIHGITRVVSIAVHFKKEGENIEAKSQFKILLSDYNIDIPLILEAKISPIIDVDVDIKFSKLHD